MRDDNTPEYRSLLVGDTRETYRPGTFGYELLAMVESLYARANAAEAEANRLTELAQPGAWEYGLRMAGDEEPYSDISEDLDWLLDGGLATVDEQVVRRRKAGPWEKLPTTGRTGVNRD